MLQRTSRKNSQRNEYFQQESILKLQKTFKQLLFNLKNNQAKNWVNLFSYHWTINHEIQELQKVPSTFATIILKTALQISGILDTEKKKAVELDLKILMNSLRE